MCFDVVSNCCLLYCMNGLICIYRKPITIALTSPQTAVFNITETDSHTVSRRAFLLRGFIDAKQWQKDATNRFIVRNTELHVQTFYMVEMC